MVKITFKSPSQQQPFTLEFDPDTIGTVENLKMKVGEHTGDSPLNIKLIYKGTFFTTQEKYSRMIKLLTHSVLLTKIPCMPSSKKINPNLANNNPPPPTPPKPTPILTLTPTRTPWEALEEWAEWEWGDLEEWVWVEWAWVAWAEWEVWVEWTQP